MELVGEDEQSQTGAISNQPKIRGTRKIQVHTQSGGRGLGDNSSIRSEGRQEVVTWAARQKIPGQYQYSAGRRAGDKTRDAGEGDNTNGQISQGVHRLGRATGVLDIHIEIDEEVKLVQQKRRPFLLNM